jgi:hypothetical protein
LNGTLIHIEEIVMTILNTINVLDIKELRYENLPTEDSRGGTINKRIK